MLTLLSQLKLTATQYLLLGLAATIGILLVALKLQGSKIHGLQLKLLEANMNLSLQQPEAVVREARLKYMKAMMDYNRAGSK